MTKPKLHRTLQVLQNAGHDLVELAKREDRDLRRNVSYCGDTAIEELRKLHPTLDPKFIRLKEILHAERFHAVASGDGSPPSDDLIVGWLRELTK